MVAAGLTALVDEIRERNLSRNRHFRLMSQSRYRAAMRLKRYLDGLADELRASQATGEPRLIVTRPSPGRVVLHLRWSRIQAERRCHLTTEELDCLCRHHRDVCGLIRQGESSNA